MTPEQTLAQRVRAKYPGAYDDLTDQQLEASVVAKFPGVYDDIPKTGAAPPAPSTATRRGTSGRNTFGMVTQKAREGLTDAVVGAGKGAAQTIGSLMRGVSTMFPGMRYDDSDQARVSRATQPTSPAQQIGFTGEKIAELAVPAGRVSTALKVAPRMTRMGAQAATGSAVTGAQGGDAEDMLTSALLMGAAPVVSDAVSAVGKAITVRLPEKLYTQVFKIAQDDLRQAFMAASKGGPPNPTLAREAIDRGLFGTSRNMAVYSLKKLDTLEAQLQQEAARKVLVLPRKQEFINLLQDIEEQFGKGFFSERAAEATTLKTALQNVKGPTARASDMLAIKRFLDGLRNTSSFRLDPKLAPRQEELKIAADLVRTTLHKQPSMSKLIGEERVFIQAVDAIVEDAVRRGNKTLLNLTDIILGGGGMAAGGPFGAAVGYGGVRAFQQPFTLTGAGQALHRLGERLPSAGAVTSTAAATAAEAQRKRR